MYTWAKKNSIAFWSLIHKGEKTPAIYESPLSTGDIYNKLFKILLSISKRESQCHSFATTKIKVKPLVDTGVKKALVCNLLFKHMYAQKIRPMFECSLS